MLGFAPISAVPLSSLPVGGGNIIYFVIDTTLYVVEFQNINFGVYPYKRLGWKSTISPTMAEKSKLQTAMGWNSKFDITINQN